jgi:hypothetical protein
VALFVDALRGRMSNDSMFHMSRAWTVLHQGKPVYETVFFGEHIKFTYPMSSLLLFSLAGVVRCTAAGLLKGLIWASVAGIVWLTGEILLRLVDCNGMWDRWERLQVRSLAAIMVVFFHPVIIGVSLGQVQTLLTCLWMLAVWAWMFGEKRFGKNKIDGKLVAGLCLGLICTFKPTLAVFLPWALLRRQWRFLLAFAGTLAAIQGLAMAVFGWHNTVGYLQVLSFMSHRGEAYLPNQSVNGFLERWTHNGDSVVWSFTVFPPYHSVVYVGTTISSALLLGFALAAPLLRGWKNGVADFLFFGMVATIVSPIAWEHHYGYFLPGCIYLLGRMHKLQGVLPALAAFCFLILTNGWPWLDRFAETRWNPVLSYDLFAGLGLLVVMAVWADRARPQSESDAFSADRNHATHILT